MNNNDDVHREKDVIIEGSTCYNSTQSSLKQPLLKDDSQSQQLISDIRKDAVMPPFDEQLLLPPKVPSNNRNLPISNNADDGNYSNENHNEDNNSSNEHSFEEQDEWDEENQGQEQEQQQPESLLSSHLFDEIYGDSRLLIILTVISDVVMCVIGLVMQLQGCGESDLQAWNKQWTWYFLAKSIYHGLILCQFRSKSKTLDVCQSMGELRTAEENTLAQQHFDSQLTERQRTLTRRALEKQMMEYYYKRNGLLKTAYYVKSICTLSYVLYGMVVFFKGDYFAIWMTNSEASQSCEYAITWWTYLSIILVIACNRQIFDLFLVIVILIPIVIFGYLPYLAYKTCKQKRKRQQTFKLFKKFKFAPGKINGDSECAICRMDYEIGEKITVLPCNELHHFHDECITSWLNVNMTCPLCRFNFAVPEGEDGDGEENNNNRGENQDEQQQQDEQGDISQLQQDQVQQEEGQVQQIQPDLEEQLLQRQIQEQQPNTVPEELIYHPRSQSYQPPQYIPNEASNRRQSLQQPSRRNQYYQQFLNPEEQQQQDFSAVQAHVNQLCQIFNSEGELTTFMRENDYTEELQDEILRIFRIMHRS